MKYLLYMILTIGLFANEDLKLLTMAYDHGLKPVPTNYEALIKSLKTTPDELSKDKVALGEKLFFEKELSLAKDISCASCHSFEKGGADGIPTAIGHKDQKNPFHLNTPTVLNTAFSKKLFWNGSSETLQSQAKGPLQAPFEMSITPKLAEKRIEQKIGYKEMFKKVYDTDKISFEKIVDAISAYERTLITKGRFDQFLLGEFDILSQKEKEGLKLFITKGCVGCHNGIGLGGQTLRKFPLSYHNIWHMDKPHKIQTLQKKYDDFLNDLKKGGYKEKNSKLNLLYTQIPKEEIKLLEEGFFDQIDKKDRSDIMITTSCKECHKTPKYPIKNSIVKDISFPFENKGGFLGHKNSKYFRVPLLRNIIRTKPYFHNGSVEKLEDAVKIMAKHQSRTKLEDKEIEKIISFFKTLDGEIIDYKLR